MIGIGIGSNEKCNRKKESEKEISLFDLIAIGIYIKYRNRNRI